VRPKTFVELVAVKARGGFLANRVSRQSPPRGKGQTVARAGTLLAARVRGFDLSSITKVSFMKYAIAAFSSVLLLASFEAQAASQSLGTTNVLVGPNSGTNTVMLSVYPLSAPWTATANAPWLHLSATNQSGQGSTTVVFSFDTNSGLTRSGTLIIAGLSLTVTQAGSNYVPARSATTLVSGIPFANALAVDNTGNVYIAIGAVNEILKWTAANNTAIPVVTSGLGYQPVGVGLDEAGDIYIGCTSDGTIKKAAGNTANTVVNSAGSLGCFGVDSIGNLYFAGNNAIQKWTAANGTISTFASSGIANPGAVAVDGVADTVYFSSGGTLNAWTAQNNAVTELASSAFIVTSVAIDGEGNVYAVGRDSYIEQSAIMKWTAANNTLTTLFDSGQALYSGVTVDAAGNIYFTDGYDGMLQESPNAYVDPTTRIESLSAGQDSLPGVLPSTQDLHAPFAPSSDSGWLTITGVTNGVVSYSFPQNLKPTRTGHISLLGQSIAVTQLGPTFALGASNLSE
jgi:hypothetical protein